MRTTPLILSMLATLALPALARADSALPREDRAGRHDGAWPRDGRGDGRDDGDRHGPRRGTGFVTLHNPNEAPLRLRIDGASVGEVAPHETLRVGPFSEGDHRVDAAFDDRVQGLGERVFSGDVRVDRRHPGRLDLPLVAMAVLRVENAWVEPMEIVVDARPAGTVPPLGFSATLVPSGARVALLGMNGEKPLEHRVLASGLALERVSLVPPASADVLVTNPARVPLDLRDDRGRLVRRLRPAATEVVSLPSGWTSLAATFGRRDVDQAKLLANPWMRTAWEVRLPATAQVAVTNDGRVDVEVAADGRFLGRVPAGMTVVFDGIATGAATLTFEASRGRHVFRTSSVVVVEPLVGAAVASRIDVGDGRGGYADRRDDGRDHHGRGDGRGGRHGHREHDGRDGWASPR